MAEMVLYFKKLVSGNLLRFYFIRFILWLDFSIKKGCSCSCVCVCLGDDWPCILSSE